MYILTITFIPIPSLAKIFLRTVFLIIFNNFMKWMNETITHISVLLLSLSFKKKGWKSLVNRRSSARGKPHPRVDHVKIE